MFALQEALRAASPLRLAIGGELADGEVPWFWSWQDRHLAAEFSAAGRPFLHGPNIFYSDNRRPNVLDAEKAISDAASCLLIFTESPWYANLIRHNLGPRCSAPIVLWRYPIEPKPPGPLPAEYDLLIYAKRGYRQWMVDGLVERYRSRVLRYGDHHRWELAEAARRARCCAYLSSDDRGPLGLAEILLTGCPAVGVPIGVPWVVPGENGFFARSLQPGDMSQAIDRVLAEGDKREAVRQAALRDFDTDKTVRTILEAIETHVPGTKTGSRGDGQAEFTI